MFSQQDFRAPQKKHRHGTRAYASCVMEMLEGRQLLSSTLHGGVLTVRAEAVSSGSPWVHVTYGNDPTKLLVDINGATSLFDTSRVRVIRIVGTKAADSLRATFYPGDPIRCVVYGRAGNDTITTGDASDLIYGGAGNDTINSGGGKDLVFGGYGDDTLNGGDGNDKLFGNAGDDNIDAGAGTNRVDSGWGQDRVLHSNFADRIVRRRNCVVVPPDNSQPPQLTELQQKMVEEAAKRYRNLFDLKAPLLQFYPVYNYATLNDGATLFNFTSAAVASMADAGTNNQVDGVDESDLVKTDGQYIYTCLDGKLTIISLADPDNPQVVSQITLTRNPAAVFVDGDRVTVVSRDYAWNRVIPFDTVRIMPANDQLMSIVQPIRFAPITTMPITIMPIFNYGDAHAEVAIYDVSDRTDPKLLERTNVRGYLQDVRDVGGQLYMTIRNNVYFPMPNSEYRETGAEGEGYYYESEESYRTRIAQYVAETLGGMKYQVTDANGNQVASGGIADTAFIPDGADLSTITTVLNFDLLDSDKGPQSHVSVVANANQIYASPTALYFTNFATAGHTDIFKVNLAPDHVSFAAMGTITGSVLGSYAMDETDGYFRVVADHQQGSSFENYNSTALFVMQQNGTSLDLVGQVSDITPNENVRSVRFMGDHTFIVTFRTVDPLVIVDLTNPKSPTVSGELVLPGFSTYLEMLDDRYLVGIGYSTTAQGWRDGSQLTIFDVADWNNPQVVEQIKLDDLGYVSTQAIFDPHAVSLFNDAGILVIPVTRYLGNQATSGFAEFTVDGVDGFTHVGLIEQEGPSNGRAFAVSGRIVTVTNHMLQVTAPLAPEAPIASITF